MAVDDSSLPAAFRSADLASLQGQHSAAAQIRWSLGCGVLAAVAGVTSFRVGEAQVDVLAAVGVAAFLGAILLTLRLGAEGFEARWYRGRAAAESVKTLAWRYAVGGDPFAVHDGDPDRRFSERVDQVLDRAGELQLEPVAGEQITPWMRDLRARSLQDRRAAYIHDRIGDQESWYTDKAKMNRSSAHRWSGVTLAANTLGIVVAVARFFGWVDVDGLGVAAAAAGAATAWSQHRQHRILASSYALAAQELSLVREKLRVVSNEAEWALAVSDAEDAISREHTMWLARRGHTAA